MNLKSIILIVALITSMNSYADNDVCGAGGSSGGSKSSWKKLKKCSDLYIDFPYIVVEGYSIKFDQLCLEEGRIRTKAKFPVSGGVWVKDDEHKDYDYLSIDPEIESQVCREFDEDGECISWETVKVKIPFKREISVYKGIPEEDSKPLFKKIFELTECE